MLVAVRTCTYKTWTNIAEWVMPTLNLALQNVRLARVEMEPHMEAKLGTKQQP